MIEERVSNQEAGVGRASSGSGSDGVSTPRHEPLRHDGQDDGGGDQLDPDHGGTGHHHEPRGAEVLQDSVQRRNQGKQGSEWENFAER